MGTSSEILIETQWNGPIGTFRHGTDLRRLQIVVNRKLLVGAVGIELKAMLSLRKLMILRTAKMAKPGEFAEARYTTGTRPAKAQAQQQRGLDLPTAQPTKGSRTEN